MLEGTAVEGGERTADCFADMLLYIPKRTLFIKIKIKKLKILLTCLKFVFVFLFFYFNATSVKQELSQHDGKYSFRSSKTVTSLYLSLGSMYFGMYLKLVTDVQQLPHYMFNYKERGVIGGGGVIYSVR